MARVKTGVEGLDELLGGGLTRARIYLVQGDPGVGKTTLSIQFLLEGVRAGERVLYVTLSETRGEIMAVAASHGWDLTGVDVYEMSTTEDQSEVLDQENTLYTPDEVELNERMQLLLAHIQEVNPRRVVIDSCSELRLLARTPLRFRRQILALKGELVARDCVVLLLENPLSDGGDVLLQSLVHGVIHMRRSDRVYGADRRQLRILKMRELAFNSGQHDFAVKRGGVVVYPRLIASDHHVDFEARASSSGIESLDALVGGGLDRGTCTLLMGPPGTGKSVVSTRFAFAAGQRGENSAIFAFDENVPTLLHRSASLGMDLRPLMQQGRVSITQLDPAELSPGDLVHRVREAVEKHAVTAVIIDSLNGYLHALPEDRFILPQLHELLSYLRQRGVMTILVIAQHGVLGSAMNSVVDVSYLADTILMHRHFEMGGRVRKAISVLKKRTGKHEDTIRELKFAEGGVALGPPLSSFRGILTGVPEVIGDQPHLSDGP
ncbi:MAG: ATPase domain-containing protein [Polyangia bacterium]